ncbi:unnamed protein product [Durusdinium trenchii]|uniref:peptidylprolyl isomerase n=2 Tax=Durusdinium trenchii TaxID=1381693 RepID=A0ABP0IH29_9DINO
MSDEEFPMTGGMGDMGDDSDMDMPSGLPEGVEKEIITDAPAGNYKQPKSGDEVTVHYVGTLASDGSQFDSSRSREKPFNFTLGKGQVIKGWDLGVATMKKGEVAKFTLSPDYAYGASGSPPAIPENATLVFEVELIDWVSKDDLFGDGGVIQLQVAEGSGWKSPKEDSEVRLSLKALNMDGSLIEDKGSMEYVMGSEILGIWGKTVEKALLKMKKGEESKLTCNNSTYAGDSHPDGLVLELKLEEVFEVTDVSPAKDKSMMKKQIKEGEGYEKPNDAAKVVLNVESAQTAGDLAGFAAKTLEFTCGEGHVCDALEFAVSAMKKGERAVLTVAGCEEPQLGLKSSEKVILTLELTSFEKAKDTWDMSEEEKVEYGAARKDVGANLFKAARYQLAMERYKKVADLFSYIDNYKEENKAKAIELKKACTLNKAACQLKLELYSDAKASCSTVLKDSANNVKALFRRAQAEFGLKNYLDCVKDVKKILELEPNNREARALAKNAQAGQKEEDKKSKGLFGKMCKALGKGPIPEPYKDKTFDFDEDEAAEENDGEAEAEAPEMAQAAAAGA